MTTTTQTELVLIATDRIVMTGITAGRSAARKLAQEQADKLGVEVEICTPSDRVLDVVKPVSAQLGEALPDAIANYMSDAYGYDI